MVQSNTTIRTTAVQLALDYLNSAHPPKRGESDLIAIAADIEDFLVGRSE